MSTIKVDTIATRTGSGNITLSNNVASLTSSGAISGTNITATANGVPLTVNSSNSNANKIGFQDNGSAVSFFGGVSNGLFFGNSSGTQIGRLDADGLKFGTDTAAANALDDYEEGTWTAQLTDGSTDVDLTTSAVYTKIGNLVIVSFDKYNVTISSLSTSALSIKTLPFTSNASGVGTKIIHVAGTSGGSNVPVLVYPISGSQTLALYKAVTSTQNMTSLTTSDLHTSVSIRLTLTYFTDA